MRVEFIQLCHLLRLLRPESLASLNATLIMRTGAGRQRGRRAAANANPLDSFFPFDPYLLRHSYPFVEPFYNDWEPLPEEVCC